MPIYEYQAVTGKHSCAHCRESFEVLQKLSDPPLENCPECGNPVNKLISAPAVGASQCGFDERARNAGFSKLKRLGKGEYEKQY
jgi:putative FmdB family regulatory protein